MADIKPFTIAVPDEAIQDLKTRLSLARFPNDELDGAGWDYGTPLPVVKRLTTYWRDTYDWRAAEAQLNQHPHFRTTIQCDGFEPLQIHFLHQRSSVENAIPLLFIHGWPGSFLEALKIYKRLAEPEKVDAPAFHFVALSLPNYGFSEGSRKKGFALAQYAETCNKLMIKLGYPQYVTQGGDWGYYISRTISLLFPHNCLATHLNMDQGNHPHPLRNPLLYLRHTLSRTTPTERSGWARTSWFLSQGSAYRSLQSTKPQTLAYALADSPAALLAWIYEKLHDWTDAYPWTDDEVCTWLSIYWFSTAGPGANVRIYYEATHEWDDPKTRVTRERCREFIGGGVKVGLSHSPWELNVLPSTWTRTQGEVVYEKEWKSGGHFFAWEKPEHLLVDVRAMFGRGGGAFGVVRGREGYIKARL